MNRAGGRFAATLCILIVSWGPRWTPAHHSYAMFDFSGMSRVSGAVRTFEWSNPHVWLWLTVVDDKGAASDYAFEGYSIGEMMRKLGWTKSTVTPGDRVVVSYFPFKDGKNGGRLSKVTLPDGRTLEGL